MKYSSLYIEYFSDDTYFLWGQQDSPGPILEFGVIFVMLA